MQTSYGIHVTRDGAHYKQVDDHDDRGYGSSDNWTCADGRWRTSSDPLPYPTKMVESGPGAGPEYCPVCTGDVVGDWWS